MTGARAWLAAVVLVLFILGGACQQNVDNFRKVQNGWSLDQVRELLGEPDEISEAQGLAAQWIYHSDEPFAGKATLIVNSLGGKVVFTTLSKAK